MPNLRKDLDAYFLKLKNERASWGRTHVMQDSDGVMFLCPKCFVDNGNNRIGTHSVICWFVGRVPDTMTPGPGRWNPSGTSINDLTFVEPGAVSVKLESGCCWHGFVKNGEAN